ncbi:DUF2332 domain-containing protein [Isoptericola variabilis]|uniref:DUF2332 domain-containing protein n=1 Tax=Isoptericola variabilis TaxID=139208 RepID=UPI00117DAE38|nr:DUF2332 domain-containing protein [Isoptericola variabilis]
MARTYAGFAAWATSGGSPCYAAWARGVAADAEVLAWLAALPRDKQHPTLVFAAARLHGVPAPGPYAGLRDALLADDGTIRATVLTHVTQTNEVGRLATLVPAFAGLGADRPLALVEAGASAGLCLYPDRWGYAWSTPDGVVAVGPEPRLACTVTGAAPLPAAPPDVAWRAGVDLRPLDVRDDDAVAWLERLVWPENDDRRAQLRRAVELARAEPPPVVEGDLLVEVPRLVEEAAAHGEVVVVHTAVIMYLSAHDRQRFDAMMRTLVADGACRWVGIELPDVLPSLLDGAPPLPEEPTMVLGVDGDAVAWAHQHGRSLAWF